MMLELLATSLGFAGNGVLKGEPEPKNVKQEGWLELLNEDKSQPPLGVGEGVGVGVDVCVGVGVGVVVDDGVGVGMGIALP